jgi:hypothetical protein
MPVLLVPCPHCAKPSRIDSAKLPDQPAFFPCPHCNGRVVVDKRQLVKPPQTPAAAPVANRTAEAGAPTATAPPPAAAPPQTAAHPPAASPRAAIAPPTVEPTVPDRRFAKVPADAVFPSGIVVGEDDSVIGEIREALAALGSEIEHVSSPDAARQVIMNEQPDLCIYVAGNIDAAPHAAMAPLTGLHPSFRRRLYIMLLAENLNTFDGNAAFIHEVNMVLGKRDLPQIGAALYRGLEYHDRLYRAHLAASEKKGSI